MLKLLVSQSVISKTLKFASDSIWCHKLSSVAFLSNRLLKVKRPNDFREIQIRHVNRFRPPPGVTPVDPKSIPFAKKDLRPRTRGLILLWIPAITFGLGTWQVQRLKWKTNLLATIKERTETPPVPLHLPIEPEELAEMEFRKVIVKGTFDHENEIFYGPKPCFVNGEPCREVVSRTGEGSYGYNLITPLVLSDSGERILVNRGWMQTKMMAKDKHEWSATEGEQTITGVVRTTEPPRSYGPVKKSKYKVWHYRNIEEMAEKKNCLPIFIDATEEHSIPNLLWGGQTNTVLRNEHLTYIITWYSLTAATGWLWYAKYFKR